MNQLTFDGQQTGEKILYEIRPHHLALTLAISRVVLLALFFFIAFVIIAPAIPMLTPIIRMLGFILSASVLGIGLWWTITSLTRDVTYLTDRRIMRFDVVSPFVTTKRALFWDEALKAKGYAPNLIYKSANIGTLHVEPKMSDHENVVITDVAYYEDLANYIDKILYTYKNKPEEKDSFRPFIPKPRGQRN